MVKETKEWLPPHAKAWRICQVLNNLCPVVVPARPRCVPSSAARAVGDELTFPVLADLRRAFRSARRSCRMPRGVDADDDDDHADADVAADGAEAEARGFASVRHAAHVAFNRLQDDLRLDPRAANYLKRAEAWDTAVRDLDEEATALPVVSGWHVPSCAKPAHARFMQALHQLRATKPATPRASRCAPTAEVRSPCGAPSGARRPPRVRRAAAAAAFFSARPGLFAA